MNCMSFLRSLWRPCRRAATDDEIVSARTENASRDNETAFAEMHKAYGEVPEAHEKVRSSIKRVTTPFADLERMMQSDLKRAKN